MISREQLRQLAEFETRYPNEVAVSFYFQPGTPKDKSHREEAIEAKDLVRRALQEVETNGRNREAMSDLQRILQLAERLHGNQARAKVVFACSGRGLWHEFDVSSLESPTRLFVNRRFHLKPLASLLSEYPHIWVSLVDRRNARFLDVHFDEIGNRGEIESPVPRHGRSDGFGGYNAGHAERHVEDETRRHFDAVAEHLSRAAERREFEALVIGCHDVNWPEFESRLHNDVKKKIAGRICGNFAAWNNERAAAEARRVLTESLAARHSSLLRETLDEARSNGRGVTGLRRVLRALELGEVETLIMARDYTSRAVECTNCRHLDSHIVRYCPVCGRATHQLEDVCEAVVPNAVRNNIGLVLLPPDDSLDRIGNIAALLRFRADRNKNQLLVAS
jgi:peptide subunit release factor 1 (eRF1)